MTGPRDPDDGPTQPVSSWPARDLGGPRAVEVSDADPSLQAGAEWDPRRLGERRRPTTAEQAVPWLIAIILALAGMVIVLLALIYTSDNGALAGLPKPSPAVGAANGSEPIATATLGTSGIPTPSAASSGTPKPSQDPSPSPSPSATPAPTYGPLEVVYLERSTAAAPIYLFRRDFAKKVDPKELAIADQGIASFAWAPDGTVGAALIGGNVGRVVAIEPAGNKRALIDGVDEIAFGQDASTLYAVKITTSGAKDRAEVLVVDFASGGTKSLTDFTYPHPQIVPESLLKEAAFTDEGGSVRLYPTSDGNLVLWILGAPATYRIDPVDGTHTPVTRTPTLWSPDGARRVETKVSGSSTTLTLRNRDNASQASVKVNGLVSNVRWSADSSEVAFTLSRLGRSGGIVQDMYIWELKDGVAPMPITSNGASFGAEWLGASQSWEP